MQENEGWVSVLPQGTCSAFKRPRQFVIRDEIFCCQRRNIGNKTAFRLSRDVINFLDSIYFFVMNWKSHFPLIFSVRGTLPALSSELITAIWITHTCLQPHDSHQCEFSSLWKDHTTPPQTCKPSNPLLQIVFSSICLQVYIPGALGQ